MTRSRDADPSLQASDQGTPAAAAQPQHHARFATTSATIERIDLVSGAVLGPVTIAYETYGSLNAARDNAVLLCHALTGDQFAAGTHPITGKPGWWDRMIGPGRPLDTDRFCVIAPNTLGGCMGSTGPASLDPDTGRSFGARFPVITIADMANAQAALMDHLGIAQWAAVVGGSMGGMLVLDWAARMPDKLRLGIAIAAAARHSAQNIAFYELGRQAIMADPDWHKGAYAEHHTRPAQGLAVARMAAHITYLSEAAMERKFARRLQDRDALSYSFEADFQVESYLRYQGRSFVERFDANSYLYITRAMDYFDMAADHGGDLTAAFSQVSAKIRLLSFTSDWHYPTPESLLIKDAMLQAGADVAHAEITSDKGHDAFLLDEPEMDRLVTEWLGSAVVA